ncbi:MAG: EutN/CcmL family microcompartment protein [Gemmatimonadota bacterium]|nr:EutN/CcmL family microcompartment protein [Gemmatimonadota bacterium]
MRLGRVSGKIVATRKDPSLKGIRLLVIRPLDHRRNDHGDALVAADVVSAGQGETVYWVSAREAPNALPDKYGPVDAAIVGIADRIDIRNEP